MAPDSQPLYRASPGVLHQIVAGEAVLLDMDREQYFGLDPIGTRCWELLQESTDLDRMVKRMLSEFEVDEARLRDDLQALLDKLLAEGLIAVGRQGG